MSGHDHPLLQGELRLAGRLDVTALKTGGQNPWNLAYPRAGSFFRAISSDDGQSGPRPHCSPSIGPRRRPWRWLP